MSKVKCPYCKSKKVTNYGSAYDYDTKFGSHTTYKCKKCDKFFQVEDSLDKFLSAYEFEQERILSRVTSVEVDKDGKPIRFIFENR